MSAKRVSPLATAFLWAAAMTAIYGLTGAMFHEQPKTIASDMGTAASVAIVVACNERKDALKPQ